MILGLAVAAWAGPWVRDPGAAYLKVAGSEYLARGFRARSVSAYAEVGLARGLQLVADLPYTWAWRDPFLIRGFGGTRLGLGLRPVRGRTPVSVHLIARVPLVVPEDRDPLALGDGQIDGELWGAVGGSLPWGSVNPWGALELGARARSRWSVAPGATDPGSDGLYRIQVGARSRRGWVEVNGSGAMAFAESRRRHQAGGSVAIAVGGDVHLELGGARVLVDHPSGPGWGATVGVSVDRTAERPDDAPRPRG